MKKTIKKKKQIQRQFKRKIIIKENVRPRSKNIRIGKAKKKRKLYQGFELPFSKIIRKIAFKSKAGALPNKPQKTNQDAYIIRSKLLNNKNYGFYAVCDGHGLYGHQVSRKVKKKLPDFIETQFVSNNLDVLSELLIKQIKQQIESSFSEMQEVIKNSSINCQFSGTTCSSILTFQNHYFSINVGDSRTIMIKQENLTKKWFSQQLTTDHKPELPEETQRIEKSGGIISFLKDFKGNQIGPVRVYDKQNKGGLAMSRSLGDIKYHNIGVSHKPEIISHRFLMEDKFIIIASDGVWEFISNEEAMNIVLPFYLKNQAEQAAQVLVDVAYKLWKQREKNVIDDITCVILFLDVPNNVQSMFKS